MKMSDAIMLGSTMLRPRPYAKNFGDGTGCALGMAEVAVSAKDSYTLEWPWSTSPSVAKSPCGCTHVLINRPDSVIAHIFNEHVCNDHTWTLEKLVDWVRSVEPQETPAVAVVNQETEQRELVGA